MQNIGRQRDGQGKKDLGNKIGFAFNNVKFEVPPETVTGWKQIDLTRTKKGAVQTVHITPGVQVFVPQGVFRSARHN